jgi:hypothetical protein
VPISRIVPGRINCQLFSDKRAKPDHCQVFADYCIGQDRTVSPALIKIAALQLCADKRHYVKLSTPFSSDESIGSPPPYGTFQLVDARSGQVYASGDGPTGYNLSLEEIEAILDRGRHV